MLAKIVNAALKTAATVGEATITAGLEVGSMAVGAGTEIAGAGLEAGAAAIGTGSEIVGVGIDTAAQGLECLQELSAPVIDVAMNTGKAVAIEATSLNVAMIENMTAATAAEAVFVVGLAYPAAGADTLTGGAVRKYVALLDPNAGRGGGGRGGPNIFNPGAHQIASTPTLAA